MTAQELIAEAKILEALGRWETERLPSRGQPLDPEDYFRTPEPWRMAFSVLKDANVVPEEVELLREIYRLESSLEKPGGEEETTARDVRRRISELRVLYDMKVQRYGRKSP